MTERRDAETAIAQLNGVEMHGRALNVNEARPKPTRGLGFQRRTPWFRPRRWRPRSALVGAAVFFLSVRF